MSNLEARLRGASADELSPPASPSQGELQSLCTSSMESIPKSVPGNTPGAPDLHVDHLDSDNCIFTPIVPSGVVEVADVSDGESVEMLDLVSTGVLTDEVGSDIR